MPRVPHAPLIMLGVGLVLAVAGCKRRPIATPATTTDAADMTRDAAAETPLDASDAPVADDAPHDVPGATHDAPDAAHDASEGDGDGAPDALAAGDGPEDRIATDARGDGGDARPADLPCGTLDFLCTPFACDVALGRCKTFCTVDDDCAPGFPCRQNTCGLWSPPTCVANQECLSGACAQGLCCDQPCDGTCMSCRLPGAYGTCQRVPFGGLDPQARCPDSFICNGRGACIPPSCTLDGDCGPLHTCTNARCVPCLATCVADAECSVGAMCVIRNGCSSCERRTP